LKNKSINLKKQEDRALWLSHGTCSYIHMYINVVADSVISQVCFWHYLYNVIFKIEHKLLYSLGVSSPPPPPPPPPPATLKNSGCARGQGHVQKWLLVRALKCAELSECILCEV
jgi:hypothetical protein